MKWPPQTFGGLFWDRQDAEGLLFWYDAVKEYNKNASFGKGSR